MPQAKLSADAAGALGRGGVDLFDAGHRGQRLLERANDQFFDLRRADAARTRREP